MGYPFVTDPWFALPRQAFPSGIRDAVPVVGNDRDVDLLPSKLKRWGIPVFLGSSESCPWIPSSPGVAHRSICSQLRQARDDAVSYKP